MTGDGNVSKFSRKRCFFYMPGCFFQDNVIGPFEHDDVAWPFYDWMGVTKAAFESVARYLAKELGPRGVRVNLVAAGPIRSIAARNSRAASSWNKATLRVGWGCFA